MVEYHCLTCRGYFEVAEAAAAPVRCALCQGDNVAPTVTIDGPSLPNVSLTFGLLSFVFGPFTGMPALMLGALALMQDCKQRGRAIAGVLAGITGTIALTAMAIWGTSRCSNQLYRAKCLLDLSRVALAEVKGPGEAWTNHVATAPAMVASNATVATNMEITVAEEPVVGTNAPTFSCYYTTTWPTNIEALVQTYGTNVAGPMTAKNYFYMPPPVNAPADIIVMTDVSKTHLERCVLLLSGDVTWLEPNEFDQALKRPENALFAYAWAAAQKPPPAKAVTNKPPASAGKKEEGASAAKH